MTPSRAVLGHGDPLCILHLHKLGRGCCSLGTEQDFGILKESTQRKSCRYLLRRWGRLVSWCFSCFGGGYKYTFQRLKRVWLFKKFQASLNAVKSSSDVPLEDGMLDQQSQEGRAWQGRVRKALGSVGSGFRAMFPALGSGKLGMGMMPTKSHWLL